MTGSDDRLTRAAERLRARTEARAAAHPDRLATTRDSRRAGMLLTAIGLGLAGVVGAIGAVATGALGALVPAALLTVAAALLLRVWQWLPLFVPDAETVELRRRARRYVVGAVVAVALAVVVAAVVVGGSAR